MLIYKLIFLFTLATAFANPITVNQHQHSRNASNSGQLITDAKNSSDAKKYYILKEVSLEELIDPTTENGAIPSEVFVAPGVEDFNYYQAAKKSRDNGKEVEPGSNDKAKVILAHVQSLLKELKKDVKAVDHQSVENLKDIIDSYKSAAIEQEANRASEGVGNHADDLIPPPEGLSEKNYYLDKTARKTKKYDAVVDAIKSSLLNSDWDHSKNERGVVDYEYDDDESAAEETETNPINAKLTLLPSEETVTSRKLNHKEFKSAVKPSDYVNYEGFQFYQPEFIHLPTPKVDVKKISYGSLTKVQPQIYRNHKESQILLNRGEMYPATAKPQTADRKSARTVNFG